MKPAIRRALVVGAGPAGLTSAIAMRRHGIEVEVVELVAPGSVLGSELAISGSMLRALAGLGLAEECVAAGVPIPDSHFCDAAGGVTAVIPLPSVAGPQYPPTVGITRPTLHRILLDAARRHGATVRFETTVTAIEPGTASTAVTFSDGSSGEYDLVVGADGVRSVVRRLVFPDAPTPWFAGQGVWRAKVPRHDTDTMYVFYGPTSKAGLLPVSATEMYLFLVVPAADQARLAREDQPAALRSALDEFGGRIAWVRDHISDPAYVYYAPLENLMVPSPWYRDRVLLIGDAAHATTPHLGYGAGIAVEDGVVLGEVLAAEDDLDAALKTFMARRFARCEMVVRNAQQLSEWELRPTADADPVGLFNSSWIQLAEPI
jgi:2-polyprenyl-6-methoxyphenol hydroxylase-like FAD-dependent oxidoreductase